LPGSLFACFFFDSIQSRMSATFAGCPWSCRGGPVLLGASPGTARPRCPCLCVLAEICSPLQRSFFLFVPPLTRLLTGRSARCSLGVRAPLFQDPLPDFSLRWKGRHFFLPPPPVYQGCLKSVVLPAVFIASGPGSFLFPRFPFTFPTWVVTNPCSSIRISFFSRKCLQNSFILRLVFPAALQSSPLFRIFFLALRNVSLP